MQLAVKHAVHNMHLQHLKAWNSLRLQLEHHASVTTLDQTCNVEYVACTKAQTSSNHRLPGWPMATYVFFINGSSADNNNIK